MRCVRDGGSLRGKPRRDPIRAATYSGAAIADLKAKGATRLGDVVHGPNCRMTTCPDTEGNSIILHQLNPKN
jgi:hypothetical protein